MQWIEYDCFNFQSHLYIACVCGFYQAFAIAVACMDGKIADRKGYEYMRKLSGTNEPPDPTEVGQLSISLSTITSPLHTFETKLFEYTKNSNLNQQIILFAP